jgi:hypothetical protein
MKVKHIQAIIVTLLVISSRCLAVDVDVKTSYLSIGSQDAREVFDSLMRKKINDIDGLHVVDDAQFDFIILISKIQFNNGTECYSLTLLLQENLAYGKKVDEGEALFGAVRPIGVYMSPSGMTIKEITECCDSVSQAAAQLLADNLAKRSNYGFDVVDPYEKAYDSLDSTNDVKRKANNGASRFSPLPLTPPTSTNGMQSKADNKH